MAKVRFYCTPALRDDSEAVCILTSFTEEHNHTNTLEMYKQETEKIDQEDEKEWLKDSTAGNVRPAQIKNMMGTKFGKDYITTKHIRNVQQKLKEPGQEKEDLRICLEQIEKEGGRVDIMYDKNDQVRALVIQTAEMRKAYIGVDPNVTQVDTTFKFETSGYKMSAFMYLNPVSNRGEVAQVAFMADEGGEVYKFVFSAFKKSVGRDPPVILLDKDFNEIQIIRKVFLTSILLLCTFHVLKWWKTLVKSSKTDDNVLGLEKKNELMEAFRDVLYASSDTCEEKRKIFENVIEGVIVKIGYGDQAYYVNLTDYYWKNWEPCKDMWMHQYRKNIAGFEDENTNNRIERFWRSTKDFLKQMASGDMTIFRAVKYVTKFIQSRLVEKYVWDQRHTMRMHDKDPQVKHELAVAALQINDRGIKKFKSSLDLLRERDLLMEVVVDDAGEESVKENFQKKNINRQSNDKSSSENPKDESGGDPQNGMKNYSKVYKTDVNSCNCSWAMRAECPCRHILFLRRTKNLSLFDVTLFDDRFKKDRNSDLIDLPGVSEKGQIECNESFKTEVEDDPLDVAIKDKGLSRGEKYKVMGPVHERLLEAMLRCGAKKIEQYADELEIMLENVKNGRSLFHKYERSVQNVDLQRKDDIELENPKIDKPSKKFDLHFITGMKTGKVGRPRDSKTKFKIDDSKKSKKIKKSTKKGELDNKSKKEMSLLPLVIEDAVPNLSSNPIICSFPLNETSVRETVRICHRDYECLRPGSFIPTDICELKLRMLQPNGPTGQVVWLFSNTLAQQLEGRFWENLRFQRQLEEAMLYQEGGCQFIFMPWCERSHFFAVIGVLGPQDRIFVMESIGTYGVPLGAEILRNFIRQVRASNDWDPVDCIITCLDTPKQRKQSNDCAFFMLEAASKLIEDPDTFFERALKNDMMGWYNVDEVHLRRQEMANLLEHMGEEQRKGGQVLETEDKLCLPKLGFKSSEKDNHKRRKCGLCREPGHTRIGCPMKMKADNKVFEAENAPPVKRLRVDAPVPVDRQAEFIIKMWQFRDSMRQDHCIDKKGLSEFMNGQFSDTEFEDCLNRQERQGKIMIDDNDIYLL